MKPLLFNLIAAAGTAIAALFCGCAETPLPNRSVNPVDPIRIGAILPLSGDNRIYGLRLQDGIRFAAEEINAGVRLNGRPVELLIRDNRSNAAVSRQLFQELVAAGAEGIIAGYDSNELLAVRDLPQASLVPTVNPMATLNALSGQRLLYRTCFSNYQQARVLAGYAWFWRKLLRIGILVNADPGDDYSREIAANVSQAFTQFGGTVVKIAEYSTSKNEYLPALREVVNASAQAILIPAGPAESGRLVKLLRDNGYSGLLLGPDTWDEPEFLKECGSSPGECAFTGFYSDEFNSPEQKSFRNRYRSRFYVYPGSCEAQGYDAMRILSIALDRAESVEQVERNMTTLKHHSGAAGFYSMRDDHEIDRSVFLKTVRPPSSPEELPTARLFRAIDMSKLDLIQDKPSQ